MYDLNDTIAAVSSPGSSGRVIIRISGPEAVNICERIFRSSASAKIGGISRGVIKIADGLDLPGRLYLFPAPDSYTGETVAEIHTDTNSAATEALMERFLGLGVRLAGPGEFTARAYFNGKMDLSQAEAVGEIIAGSNKFQLSAAEKLLSGRLAVKSGETASEIMDCLGLIEAGIDFGEQDIEFISIEDAIEKLEKIKARLEELLAGSIRCERVIDLPSVGIAGAPGAGKSSLSNAILGEERSIVSARRKTTRDVLAGIVTLEHGEIVMFDCAGLVTEAETILDELAQRSAIEALSNSDLVIFCVDISKNDWSEDTAIREFIRPKDTGAVIAVATKCDLLSQEQCLSRLEQLKTLFGRLFLQTSAKTGEGLEKLRRKIDEKIVELAGGTRINGLSEPRQSAIALTRHRQWVIEAIENIDASIVELAAGNDEIAAMTMRSAYQGLCDIQCENIDEKILENIFSRFCIGK